MISFKNFLLEHQHDNPNDPRMMNSTMSNSIGCLKRYLNKYPKFWNFWAKAFDFIYNFILLDNLNKEEILNLLKTTKKHIYYADIDFNKTTSYDRTFFDFDAPWLFDKILDICLKNNIISDKNNIYFKVCTNNTKIFGHKVFGLCMPCYHKRVLSKIDIYVNKDKYSCNINQYIMNIIFMISTIIHELLHAECIRNNYPNYIINKLIDIKNKNVDKKYMNRYFNLMSHRGLWNNMMNDVASKYCIPIDEYNQIGEQDKDKKNQYMKKYYFIIYAFIKWIEENDKYNKQYDNDKNEFNLMNQDDSNLSESDNNKTTNTLDYNVNDANFLNNLGIPAKQIDDDTIELAIQ